MNKQHHITGAGLRRLFKRRFRLYPEQVALYLATIASLVLLSWALTTRPAVSTLDAYLFGIAVFIVSFIVFCIAEYAVTCAILKSTRIGVTRAQRARPLVVCAICGCPGVLTSQCCFAYSTFASNPTGF
jgi:hypothetical protein